MNLLKIFQNWKIGSLIWNAIEPFVMKLIEKNVPTAITKLYENLAKPWQPIFDSLFKLKNKIKQTPNELDDYCFRQGVNLIEAFADNLLCIVQKLRD